MWILVNRYGGMKGRYKSFEKADEIRLSLDDWWMWSVEHINNI